MEILKVWRKPCPGSIALAQANGWTLKREGLDRLLDLCSSDWCKREVKGMDFRGRSARRNKMTRVTNWISVPRFLALFCAAVSLMMVPAKPVFAQSATLTQELLKDWVGMKDTMMKLADEMPAGHSILPRAGPCGWWVKPLDLLRIWPPPAPSP
jgi:hypothetical protein